MRRRLAVFVVLTCCALFLDERWIAVLVSPRAVLVYVLALWLRCEACVQSQPHVVMGEVKENYELSQTVMNLSDQH